MEYIVLGAVLFLIGAGSADNCTDIDSTACSLLHAKQPNLCQDPTLSDVCKRYCGYCPIVCNSCPQLVQNPSECNGRVICGLGEVCYMMEVTDFDHIHGFRGGCVSKDLCIPDYQTTLIGRRSDSNLKMYCCTEDNCNTQVLKETTVMTTASPTTTKAHHHTLTSHCIDDPRINCHLHLSRCSEVFHAMQCRHTCGLCCQNWGCGTKCR